MHTKTSLIKLCLLPLFVIAFVFAFIVLQLPGASLTANALQNAGHTLAFCALTFAALIRVSAQSRTLDKSFRICSWIMTVGILIEIGQWLTGRGFSSMDILNDFLGTVAGICFFFGLLGSAKNNYRLIAFAAGTLILSHSLTPSLKFWISGKLTPSPPVLVDFDQWGAEHRIRNIGTFMTIGRHDSVWKNNKTLSAAVQFLPGRWPSIQFIEPYAIWDRFGCFTARVYNSNQVTVAISLRIDDPDLGPDDDDHMTTTRHLLPGETRITIPLHELRDQALLKSHPGKPLMKRIRSFMLYVNHVDEPINLLMDDIVLGCKP